MAVMRAILLVLFAVACSGSDPSEEPVPATPLAGSLNGTPWTAGSAKARNAPTPGEMRIWIHPDTELGCTGFGDEPYVALVMPWIAGTQTIGLQSEATVFIYFELTAHVVLEGRIELPDAATEVGATPLLRLRAVFEDTDDDLFVEGEIPVEICE